MIVLLYDNTNKELSSLC